MALPVNSNPVSALPQQSASAGTAPVSSGVSNVGSSISSAAETQNEGFFACIAKPFISAWNAIVDFFASLFKKSIVAEDIQTKLDRFMHNRSEKHQWKAFQEAQNQLPADEVQMFYDLLPIDMQKHMKRHIWEINGNDNNMGIFFGDAVVRDDIKGELVKKAIAQCLKEVS